jgi:hypothetical protein
LLLRLDELKAIERRESLQLDQTRHEAAGFLRNGEIDLGAEGMRAFARHVEALRNRLPRKRELLWPRELFQDLLRRPNHLVAELRRQ